ncbi:transcriptional regulator [Escherichia coli]|uniref:Transcriptional regulator n=2 Tax=Escherichia coli TaxID=562 RepID=A0A829UM20_ECOLX|nr:transcriptional regulator [Escherichia coli]EEZ6010887.1 transcriptional regulator [Escherichia coli O117]KAE9899036.1 transcriptional regulator [Enterobacteriaceae bacterium TzEc052]KAE9911642.1 transcriptional regulator [Enterobacteriaceae bacterium TzEc051]EEV5982480.1 transcriptional regulator [Escherichia coli]EEV7161049.1 transcriptional regulator [Escherichia coli]
MINQLTFTKHYDTFDNVSKIYSDKFPQGKDLDLLHIVLYFRFLSYQENNLNCYESHETLAKIFKSSASTIKRKINDLKEMGLLETSPHPDPYISSLIYNALPLTDAHITPPGESSLSDLSEAEEAQEQPKGHKQPSFDVLDDWDAPLPWETEETPVSSNEKVANDNEEDVLENFASLIIQEKNTRTGGASFIEFANSLAYRHGLKRPNGIEAYFSKNYPNVYDDFDIPF